ncbi:hypothetical protein RRG08_065286 [Elysia crispata]|uniref:Uncharacterized protein n=1 Tax=Elysia crispata TaxID=231223 RepID=A0AAE0YWE7_9GAST|nr:hypothetical protein RRG08_065286 [Elysia crispata]
MENVELCKEARSRISRDSPGAIGAVRLIVFLDYLWPKLGDFRKDCPSGRGITMASMLNPFASMMVVFAVLRMLKMGMIVERKMEDCVGAHGNESEN